MVVWCDSTGSDEKMYTRTTYFHICRPKTVDAHGLFQSLKSALLRLGISDIDAENCKRLVGIGSDGASANIARGGLKGLVESQCEWVFWMWCLAHRLELAVKDGLKGTAFVICSVSYTTCTKGWRSDFTPMESFLPTTWVANRLIVSTAPSLFIICTSSSVPSWYRIASVSSMYKGALHCCLYRIGVHKSSRLFA